MIDKIVKMKVYGQRMGEYSKFLGIPMFIYLILSDLERRGLPIDLGPYTILATIGVIILVFVAAVIEDKTGMWAAEMKLRMERTPQMLEILERMKRVDEAVERLNGK